MKESTLPSKVFRFKDIVLKEKHVRDFHQVVGWEIGDDYLHPCYLHSVAFPLHMMLLLEPDFPFPLLGLVHINNQITQIRPMRVGERLSVNSHFGHLEIHPKGWLFSINVAFHIEAEVVWKSESTNLFLCKHEPQVESFVQQPSDISSWDIKSNWQLKGNLGRRYAKVSGDFNPIHVSKWTAKLFGFKQHIIHGMWTKSYCLSELQKVNSTIFNQGFVANIAFKQPLYLPNQVQMLTGNCDSERVSDTSNFKVLGSEPVKGQQALHLVGNIRSI
ncbi:MAG: MaoC/PaaZ C-terminal domain-containing protein [Paraglaciecola sp.]|uniref:MaoC/PaaZ C-terminal domain-containing protein n=1 Tax=Paraglaciecola sp. TaxID=1920173 RepID=UPI003297D581